MRDELKILKELLRKIENENYNGYDPYDIKGTKLYSRNFYTNNFSAKVKRKILDIIDILAPKLARKVMRIKKEKNAKAMGLFLMTYLNMYEVEHDQNYLEKIEYITDWLISNSNRNYKGLSWGYPFNWNSVIYIPKNTPSSIASVTIGEAFLKIYNVTKNDKFLNYAEEISKFLLSELNIYYRNYNELCFSYTPLDEFQVNNINLLNAAFLLELGTVLKNDNLINVGKKAANFSISEQNEDGSIYYWSKKQNKYNPNHLDIYHSGFEIRALYRIKNILKEQAYQTAFEKYRNFFFRNYFEKNQIKIRPDSIYPIDIHGCAEAINCVSFIDENKKYKKYADIALDFTFKNMYYKNYFIYKIIKIKRIKKRIKISYIRWGDAWMAKALSEYIYRYYKESIK